MDDEDGYEWCELIFAWHWSNLNCRNMRSIINLDFCLDFKVICRDAQRTGNY